MPAMAQSMLVKLKNNISEEIAVMHELVVKREGNVIDEQ